MSHPTLPCDDLRRLAPADLQIVLAWVQDRMLNAITPLDMRLQMEMPGSIAADPALQAGVHACRRVQAAIRELQAVACMAQDVESKSR